MNSSNYVKLSDLANPSSIRELYERKEAETKRRKELAEKVMNAKGLTTDEKQEIYSLLTSSKPPVKKRGRPTENLRNMNFAIDYLELKYSKKWTGINDIAIKHGIQTEDHTTIYKALNKGLKLLEKSTKTTEQAINKISNYFREKSLIYEDDPDLKLMIADTQYKSTLLELHRLIKEQEKLTGKKVVLLNSQ